MKILDVLILVYWSCYGVLTIYTGFLQKELYDRGIVSKPLSFKRLKNIEVKNYPKDKKIITVVRNIYSLRLFVFYSGLIFMIIYLIVRIKI
jgi:hypothetical protein